MSDRHVSIQGIRDRLTGLLADWGAELSAVLKELEEKRARVEELEAHAAACNGDLQGLRERVAGQDALIEALKADAEETSTLRNEVRDKDLEFERVSSELDSKKELIRALRRDAEGADRLKSDAKIKDREIEELKAQAARAERRAEELGRELEAIREAAASDSHEESAELEAVRAELEARKTLIKSLRADQERVASLESSLEEKRQIVVQLEASINRNATTITELKRSADAWKRKYQSIKGTSSTAATSVGMPALSETDVRAIEHLEQSVDSKQDATIAIDMRRSLLEARRTAAQGNGEK